MWEPRVVDPTKVTGMRNAKSNDKKNWKLNLKIYENDERDSANEFVMKLDHHANQNRVNLYYV